MSRAPKEPRRPVPPPLNPEAERAVLGGLLIDPRQLEHVVDLLRPEDFQDARYETLYRVIQGLHRAGQPVDVIHVDEALKREGALGEVGQPYVHELVNTCPTSTLTPRYARIVLENAVARQKLYVGHYLSCGQISSQEATQQLAELDERLERVDTDGADSLTLRALMGEPLPPLRWIVPGMVPEGLVLFAAKQKIGKSWLALCLLIAVAAGGMFLNRRVEQGEALYLALEDGKRRLQARASKLLGHDPVPEGAHLETRWPRLDQGGLTRLERWLKRHPAARLVIIDVLQKVRPPQPKYADAYAQDYAVMAGLKALAETHHVAILVIHHTRKAAAEDVFDEITGSTGIAAASDAVMVLQRPRGQQEATLHITGREIERETSYAVQFDPSTCTWQLLGEAQEYALSQQRRAIVEAIKAAGTPLTPKEVTEAMEHPPNYHTLKNTMRAMAKDGQLTVVEGKYAIAPSLRSPDSPSDREPGREAGPRKTTSDGHPIVSRRRGRRGKLILLHRPDTSQPLLPAPDYAPEPSHSLNPSQAGSGTEGSQTSETTGTTETSAVTETIQAADTGHTPICPFCQRPTQPQPHVFADGLHSQCCDMPLGDQAGHRER